MKSLRFLFLLALLAISTLSQQAPDDIRMQCADDTQCLENDECCPDVILGDVCYNPETHRCVWIQQACGEVEEPEEPEEPEYPPETPIPPEEPEYNETEQVPPGNETEEVPPGNETEEVPPEEEQPEGQPQRRQQQEEEEITGLCGPLACLDEEEGMCFRQRRLCGINDNACGTACYDTRTHVCFQDNLLCPIDFVPCGDACYNAEFFICNEQEELEPRPDQLMCVGSVCDNGEDCCGPSQEFMENGQNETSNQGICYAPGDESCCRVMVTNEENGEESQLFTSCPITENGKAQYCCPTENGEAECYDPDTQFCCHTENGNPTGPICSLDDDPNECCAGELAPGNETEEVPPEEEQPEEVPPEEEQPEEVPPEEEQPEEVPPEEEQPEEVPPEEEIEQDLEEGEEEIEQDLEEGEEEIEQDLEEGEEEIEQELRRRHAKALRRRKSSSWW